MESIPANLFPPKLASYYVLQVDRLVVMCIQTLGNYQLVRDRRLLVNMLGCLVNLSASVHSQSILVNHPTDLTAVLTNILEDPRVSLIVADSVPTKKRFVIS